jgi:probable HAF family extracellular repeat protein
MKITLDPKVHRCILAAAFSAGLGLGTSAFANSYLIDLNSKTATDIGALGGSGSSTWPSAINDAGQVVGTSGNLFQDTHAFITGADGVGIRDLGTLGRNINDARGINGAGRVVGISTNIYFFNSQAFITGPDGVGMKTLRPDLFPTDVRLTGINDADQVVGYTYDDTSFASRAFITGPDGVGTRDLGSLGGLSNEASAINEAGQIVGASSVDVDGGPRHAFITGPDGMGMRDLGTLGGRESFADAINDVGQVVGVSETAAGAHHAFITGPDGEGMMDLNSLSLVGLPAGVVIESADGINNAGQVIAIAVAIPEPEVYALFLAGLALIGFIARRRKMGGEASSLGEACS